MSRLFKTDLVKYKCSCDLFHPLSELYVCRTCVLIKCNVCAFQHVDGCFCRACFENVALTEARLNKNRCPSCYQCPVCQMVLTARSVNEKHRLLCNNCKFTSLDAGFEDNESQTWTKPDVINTKFYDELKVKIKELSRYEKVEVERNDKRRRSNMLYNMSDKFGLHSMLTRKRLDANPVPLPIGDKVIRDVDVEELSLDEIMKPVDPILIPKYEQQLTCLEDTNAQLYPSSLLLTCRRSLRCNISDHGLVRSEYNPAAVNFRVKAFASQFVPDIRIYRPVELILKMDWPLFIYVTNHTIVPVSIRLEPINFENDDKFVSCKDGGVECTIPPPNTLADANEQLGDHRVLRGLVNSNSSVVFKKRHRAAVHFRVKPKLVQPHNYLLFNFTYQFEGNPFPISDQPQIATQNTRVLLNLGPSSRYSQYSVRK